MARYEIPSGGTSEGNGVSGASAAHLSPTGVWPNVLLALAGCLWGTGFLFGKIAFREMTLSENISYRFLFGCLPLIPIPIRRKRAVARQDIGWLLAAAIVGVPVAFLVQFKGLQLTTVSHASLIVGTVPVLLALTSVLFLHERLSKVEWMVLLLSPLGVVAIAFSAIGSATGSGPTLAGDLLVLLSMCAAVASILITKHLIKRYDSLDITAWTIMLGAVLLILGTEFVHPVRFHFSPITWGAVAGQGILATAGAYLSWNWGLARVPASRAGVFVNLEPLIGTILGVAILHERLGPPAILGAALILGPAIYFSRRGG